jgi:hypothetical protein
MDSGDITGTAWFDDLKLELLSTPICYTLTKNVSPSGSGAVSADPSPNCNNGTQYVHGTVVKLTATPNTGYSFGSWSGDATGSTSPAYVTMTANKSVTANSTINTYLLTVSKAGTGSGTVTSNPAGINCGTDCSYAFAYNTPVTLTATPTSPSTFGGWSGGGCSGTGTCTVTMSSAQSVTATFNAPGNQTLTVSSIGAQDGWILESTETSNMGGSMNFAATTFFIGDNAARKQYRGILSFSTGVGLPDTAVITKVTLKVKKQGIAGGGDPVAIFQGFMVDIKKGFFGTTALQTTDFQTAANKSYGPFLNALSGGWYSIDLTGGKDYINKLNTLSGLTQIRLRFKLDDNNNAVANYLSLFSGNAPVASRPQLVITYYVP